MRPIANNWSSASPGLTVPAGANCDGRPPSPRASNSRAFASATDARPISAPLRSAGLPPLLLLFCPDGKKRLIELACEQAEAAGIVQLNEDEAGPYQAIPQPGASWQAEGHPVLQPHEYERGGTAKLLTLFHPATGLLRAKGVFSVTNAVLHPWLKGELSAVLADIEKAHPREELPPEAERPLCAQWETWLGHPPRGKPLPPLRIVLVLDNLAGHLSYDLVQWFFEHGVMPLYTPIGGSWLNMAESVQRIIVPRALAGHHPKNAQEVIDWLEQTVVGWNKQPTPFVWNGKRRRRRERAHLRRLGGSGAALVKGYSFAS